MKKTFWALMAFILLVGMTQCKKEQSENAPIGDRNRVYITMKVAGDSEKHTVYPGSGAVVYGDGDVIYVGHNGTYAGSLTYAEGTFSGTIYPESGADDYLHFYFTGGTTPATAPTTGDTDFTVSIADQSSNLPVLSYSHSTAKYSSGTTSYSATLLNKCGLVKFTTTDIDADITISGMNNTVTVDFAANNGATMGEPYSFSKSGDGNITLHRMSNTERWAILLPQGEVTTATATATGYATLTAFTVPAITANMYHNSGISVDLTATPFIDAVYTVAPETTVRFARGNLIAVSDGVYGFDANQYDVHTSVATLSSGYPRYYFTWNEIASSSNNPVSFTIGGSTFKTLTNAQWLYVLGLDSNARGGTSVSASGHFYAKAVVNGINGLILLPDNWNDSYYSLSNYNTTNAAFNGNTITTDQWAILEGKGCVFLPVAGYSNGNSVIGATTGGNYWSCTEYNNTDAYSLLFGSSIVRMSSSDSKTSGNSVRLVRFD